MNNPSSGPKRQAVQERARSIRRQLDERAPLESLAEELAELHLKLDDVVQQVRRLRASRAVEDLLLPEAAVLYKGVSHARVDAGMPLDPGAGFHRLEYDAQGRTYRWTGPAPVFHFDLHLDRTTPLHLELRLLPSVGSNMVRLFCDGAEVPCRRIEHPDHFLFEAVLLPRAALGLTRLHFVAERVEVYGEESGDGRMLGVVFRDLDLAPTTEEAAREFLAGFEPSAADDGGLVASDDPVVEALTPALTLAAPVQALHRNRRKVRR